MDGRAEWLEQRRRLAWEHGRRVRDDLLSEFANRYAELKVPPPAMIIDELLSDFLDVELRYDPLPSNVFARTECVGGRLRVTVNSMTSNIRGVRDSEGVQNVAKWHEAIHVIDDAEVVRSDLQPSLPGLTGTKIVCYRTPAGARSQVELSREFWAEEAGRAAAVSHEALKLSVSFAELCELASSRHGPISEAWPLLYRSAADIGVNITALVRQLSLEGRISLQGADGRDVHVQPALMRVMEAG